MTELWYVREAFTRGARRLTTEDDVLVQESWRIARGEAGVELPLRLTLAEGRRPVDWVGTDFGLTVISPRVVDALRELGATGWNALPIAVDSDGWDGYASLVVTGRTGPRDEARSTEGWSEETDIAASMPIYKGLGLDMSTWDGSDVSVPENARFTLVTGRVRDVLSSMTNVALVRERDIELPRYED